MKVLAICLIALVASTHAMTLWEKYPLNYSPKRSLMTVLTQVEAKLKSGGPLDAITKMLDDFVTAVTEEQLQHDQLYERQTKECEEEFAFRKKEIEDAVAALKEAKETLDGCTTQLKRAEGDLQITKKQLAENRSFLATIEETRRREAYNYETQSTSYQMAISAIEEALEILEQIWSGDAELVQLVKHTNVMLKHHMKIRKTHLLAPFMGALAQVASSEIQADEGLLERLKDVGNKLLDKIRGALSEAAAAEAAAVEAYEQDKARLEATIAGLEQQQVNLEQEIKDLNKCIVTQTAIVEASVAKRDRNQKLLDDAVAMCDAFVKEYEAAKQARTEELELLAAIRERVEARFAEMSEGVRQRGMQDEFSYENKSEYVDKEFQASEEALAAGN